jgi:AcrR family transcriptional regulator
MTQRMMNRSEPRRQEIVAAARDELDRLGYYRATLAGVASRMGGSKSTIYNYFNSKEELFGEALAMAAQPEAEALLATLDPRLPLPERLTAFARASLRLQCRQDAIALQRLLATEVKRSREITRALYDNSAINSVAHIAALFADEQHRGVLRPGDCLGMARQFAALLAGDLPTRLIFGERTDFTLAEQDGAADAAVAMFLAAYAAR